MDNEEEEESDNDVDDDDVEYRSDDPADRPGLHAEADGENNDDAAGPPTKRTRRSFAPKKRGKSMVEDVFGSISKGRDGG